MYVGWYGYVLRCCVSFFSTYFHSTFQIYVVVPYCIKKHKSILINYHLTKKFICPTLRLLENCFDILYASISVWVHIENHVLNA
jgi:hypothetical protein